VVWRLILGRNPEPTVIGVKFVCHTALTEKDRGRAVVLRNGNQPALRQLLAEFFQLFQVDVHEARFYIPQ
jgi:hypothetical protein